MKRTSYNTSPIHVLRRMIRASNLEDEQKCHALLFLESIKALVGQDPRQLLVAKNLCFAQARCIPLEAKLFNVSLASKEDAALSSLLIKWQERAEKASRMLGVTKTPGKRSGGRDSASVFTPPRVKSATEQFETGVAI